jgi:hypothetical protein
MQMFWQNHNSVYRERMPMPHLAKGLPQQRNVIRQQRAFSFGQIDRKGKSAAGDEVASIGSHRAGRLWILYIQSIMPYCRRRLVFLGG